jgi:Tfp pilus assembly protein PilN
MRAVNLLPRDTTRQRRKGMTVLVQLAVVSPFVVGSLLAAGYLLASSKVNDNRATLEVLKDQLAAVPPPVIAHQAAPELALLHDQRIIALGPALQARVAWDRILREVSSVLPGDVWLTTLSAQSVPVVVPTVAPPSTDETTTSSTETTTTPAPPPPPATSPLRLSGYTYSQEGVARLLSRLEVIPELQDVKLIQSTQTLLVGRDVFSFSIQASVRAPVSP